MKFMRYLLFPFTLLYAGIMQLRNRQYDNGNRPVSLFEKVVISVGNLSTGGTGKSPLIEKLIRLLTNHYSLATVSRGYGRKTRGERIASELDNARTLGDEPFQFYRKFGEQIKVVVGEERVLAIPHLLMDFPETEVLLLDDAYQHRKVARDLNILLSDYSAPFYLDHVLPAGNLREARSQASRADLIVITKCPKGLDETEKAQVVQSIARYNNEAPVFFSSIRYSELQPVFGQSEIKKEVATITAIANPKPFYQYLSNGFNLIEKFEFVDHYNFKRSDLDRILRKLNGKSVSLITTEKDMVRLLPFADHPLMKQFDLFYQPIEVEIENEASFEKLLIEAIEKRKRELNS